jgi:NADH:ubiquinone oxidoreductase subunit F (NADH-binding)/NADH:ubiquinone oxidoreductase subunit E
MRLLRRFHELQEIHGYLTEELLRELARSERVPLYRLQGLVSFYPHFRTSPPPRVEISICRDMACWLANGEACAIRVREALKNYKDVEVRGVSCLGRCESAPVGSIKGKIVSLKDSAAVREWAMQPESIPRPSQQPIRQWRCDPYRTPEEQYGVVRELQNDPSAGDRLLGLVKEIKLRGMGGAGFPTGAKLEMVRNETRTPKYVICNADESEPGTFKDRVILAELSHLIIEAMILAGIVTGAKHGILYIRHEYEPERRAFELALSQARKLRLVGPSAPLDIEVFVSPGGYILGEETALLEALEDKRGEPRSKPPYPGTRGLFGQPTLINNVETFAMVPGIIRKGPAWWNSQGKPGFAGLKFIALSGHVEQPGVYEVPMGTTVRELIDMGGGVKDGRTLKAFAPGGASSNFLPASMVDVPLDFAALAKAGSMLGSGAVVVVAEGTDMLDLSTNVVSFFRNESCGKCVPCRAGTQQAVEMLESARLEKTSRKSLAVLPDLGETMALTSICGLGQVALNPILSVMKHWPEEVPT